MVPYNLGNGIPQWPIGGLGKRITGWADGEMDIDTAPTR